MSSGSVPFALSQNPSPNPISGQESLTDRSDLVRRIMSAFRSVLPSNYVSQTNGPWYTLQFQAMAEQLADIQISATEVYKDNAFDFTRTDFLWQTLGSLVFPDSDIPVIDGDIRYRDFLRTMVLALLEGSKKSSMVSGVEALDPGLVVSIFEKYLDSPPRNPGGFYSIDDQFSVDIMVEGFSGDPFVLRRNAEIVLEALKPAHVIYSYSYLFRDSLQPPSDVGGLSLELGSYHYDDPRRWCLGVREISGLGSTLLNRTFFSDPNVSFGGENLNSDRVLTITSGPNVGRYRVTSTRALLSGADPTPRPYTLSSGGGGILVAVSEDSVSDPSRNWGTLAVDTKVTITSGPNLGTYRVETVLGQSGGPIGTVGISGGNVRLSRSVLELDRRMPTVASSQPYSVTVDRLGAQVIRPVSGEDCSSQFLV